MLGFIEDERLSGARMLTDFFYYLHALWRELRRREKGECFVQRDGVWVANLHLKRAELAVAPYVWTESSGV